MIFDPHAIARIMSRKPDEGPLLTNITADYGRSEMEDWVEMQQRVNAWMSANCLRSLYKRMQLAKQRAKEKPNKDVWGRAEPLEWR